MFDDIYQKVEKIAETATFDYWLTIDIKPFKNDLLKLINSWSNVYKMYLVDKVVNRYIIIKLKQILKVLF